MKLEDIYGVKKIKSIRALEETFKKFKIIGAHTQRNQNQLLTDLVDEEMKKLNIKI